MSVTSCFCSAASFAVCFGNVGLADRTKTGNDTDAMKPSSLLLMLLEWLLGPGPDYVSGHDPPWESGCGCFCSGTRGQGCGGESPWDRWWLGE